MFFYSNHQDLSLNKIQYSGQQHTQRTFNMKQDDMEHLSQNTAQFYQWLYTIFHILVLQFRFYVQLALQCHLIKRNTVRISSCNIFLKIYLYSIHIIYLKYQNSNSVRYQTHILQITLLIQWKIINDVCYFTHSAPVELY